MKRTFRVLFFLLVSLTGVESFVDFKVTHWQNCPKSSRNFMKFFGVSVEQCVDECSRRQSCRSVGYRWNLCEVHLEDVTFQDNGDSGPCIFIKKDDMATKEAAMKREMAGHVCDASTGHCHKECAAFTIWKGKVYGNRRYAGAKVAFACDNGYREKNGEKSATCKHNGEWSYSPICEPVVANSGSKTNSATTNSSPSTMASSPSRTIFSPSTTISSSPSTTTSSPSTTTSSSSAMTSIATMSSSATTTSPRTTTSSSTAISSLSTTIYFPSTTTTSPRTTASSSSTTTSFPRTTPTFLACVNRELPKVCNYHNSNIFFSLRKVAFNLASVYCSARSGNLITIDSSIKNNFIKDGIPVTGFGTCYWIDGHRDSENVWRFSNGEKIQVEWWDPNDNKVVSKDCIAIDGKTLEWQPEVCNKQCRYICELKG